MEERENTKSQSFSVRNGCPNYDKRESLFRSSDHEFGSWSVDGTNRVPCLGPLNAPLNPSRKEGNNSASPAGMAEQPRNANYGITSDDASSCMHGQPKRGTNGGENPSLKLNFLLTQSSEDNEEPMYPYSVLCTSSSTRRNLQ